ncbi:MAG: ABC transporter substrate-binding protein, partial [Chloroflexi bacterium]|nr:ABC transporter substrate-binding protein [Chloroflexota bacterium]
MKSGAVLGVLLALTACGGAAAPGSASPATSPSSAGASAKPAVSASTAPATSPLAGASGASTASTVPAVSGSAAGKPAASGSAPAAALTSTKDTLTIVFQAQQSTFDPHFAATEQDNLITRNIYDSLLRYKPNSGDLTGDLATSWDVSPDGLTYTFKLRQDVDWQKGFGHFTANDVKASFDRLKDPATKSPFANVVSMLKQVDVVDDYTVKMTLSQPYAPFLQLLVNYRTGGIVNMKAVQQYGANFNYNPVGTGPYQLDSATPKQGATLVASPDYKWGPPPPIKKIVTQTVPDLNAEIVGLQNGQYDMIDGTFGIDQTTIDQLKSKNFNFDLINRLTPEVMLWNINVKPFDNLNFRQAVAYAVDRQNLIDLAANGIGTPWYSPVPQGFLYATSDGIPHYDKDLNKSKQLLQQAGFTPGTSVTMQVYDVQKTASDVVSEQLKQVGITVQEQILDQPTFIADVLGDKGINWALHCCQRQPDPDIILSDMFSPKLRGAIYISHADLENELAAARVETNTQKRQQDYVNLQKEIMDQALMVPLYMGQATAITKGNLQGVPT